MHTKAKLLFHRKNIESNGDIIEMKIWQMPDSKDKPHGLKYSLVYIQNGKRIIGFDNAEGKGDHKHYRGKEYIRGNILIHEVYLLNPAPAIFSSR